MQWPRPRRGNSLGAPVKLRGSAWPEPEWRDRILRFVTTRRKPWSTELETAQTVQARQPSFVSQSAKRDAVPSPPGTRRQERSDVGHLQGTFFASVAKAVRRRVFRGTMSGPDPDPAEQAFRNRMQPKRGCRLRGCTSVKPPEASSSTSLKVTPRSAARCFAACSGASASALLSVRIG